jgi:hypothetical protein
MTMARRFTIKAVAILAILSVSPQGENCVLGGEHHRRVACSRCGIPNYRYGHDTESQRASFVAIGDSSTTVQQQRWHPTAAGTSAETVSVRKRTFVIPVRELQADSVTLDSIGLFMYDDGTIHATGRLSHAGGPTGELLTRGVVIRLHAIAWLPGHEGQPSSAPVVWTAETHARVPRNAPEQLRLVASDRSVAELFRHFDAITHFEVELECLRDR